MTRAYPPARLLLRCTCKEYYIDGETHECSGPLAHGWPQQRVSPPSSGGHAEDEHLLVTLSLARETEEALARLQRELKWRVLRPEERRAQAITAELVDEFNVRVQRLAAHVKQGASASRGAGQ